MAESKKGITLPYRANLKKNMCSLIFFVLMLHIKFQVPSSSGSLVLQQTKGATDRWMNGQAQTNMPPQLLQSSGHKNSKVTIYKVL